MFEVGHRKLMVVLHVEFTLHFFECDFGYGSEVVLFSEVVGDDSEELLYVDGWGSDDHGLPVGVDDAGDVYLGDDGG